MEMKSEVLTVPNSTTFSDRHGVRGRRADTGPPQRLSERAVIDRLQKDEPGAGQRDIRGMDGTGAVQPVGRCHHFGTSVFEQPEFMVEVVDRAALALAEASQDTRCQYDDPQYG